MKRKLGSIEILIDRNEAGEPFGQLLSSDFPFWRVYSKRRLRWHLFLLVRNGYLNWSESEILSERLKFTQLPEDAPSRAAVEWGTYPKCGKEKCDDCSIEKGHFLVSTDGVRIGYLESWEQAEALVGASTFLGLIDSMDEGVRLLASLVSSDLPHNLLFIDDKVLPGLTAHMYGQSMNEKGARQILTRVWGN